MPRIYENFTHALKVNACFESVCFCDEETLDVSDEEPEVDAKYESLNKEAFKKYPSFKGKMCHKFD